MRKYIVTIFIITLLCIISSSVSAVEYNSNEEVMTATAEIIRDKMLTRESSFNITTQYLKTDSTENFDKEEYAKDIFFQAVSDELYTTLGSGDYLWSTIKSYGYGGTIKSVVSLEDGSELYTISVHGQMKYHTTLEQESQLETSIKNWVINNIDQEFDSDFEKIFKIYKYITENVRYDYTFQNNSAYNAFFDKSSVCSGYASLFYRMLKESGVNEVRYITGLADNGSSVERHAWNLIKLDGKYYYCDPTWDEGNPYFWNFLRGAEVFESLHSKDSRYNFENYTISNQDFNFFTNKVNVNSGLLSGFNISNGIISQDDLLNGNYLKDNLDLDIKISCDNGNIGTDSRIIIEKDGIELNNYVVIMYGDINGDGEITAFDALNLIKGINKKIYFENPYIIEASRIVSGEGENPTAVDALAIVKHLNKKYTINQNK